MALPRHRGVIATVLISALGLLSGMGFGAELDKHSQVSALGHVARPDKAGRPHFARTFEVAHFLRGNVHTHTTVSDGGSSPEQTITWYRTHGYQFLALTDHNSLSRPARYASLQEP